MKRRVFQRVFIFVFALALFLCLNACSKPIGAAEKSTAPTGNFFALQPFILNLVQGDATYIKMSVALELTGPQLAGKAEAKTAQLRDAIIVLLSPKSKADIVSQEGKMQLKDEILLKSNEILGQGMVKDVYFTDLVMQ